VAASHKANKVLHFHLHSVFDQGKLRKIKRGSGQVLPAYRPLLQEVTALSVHFRFHLIGFYWFQDFKVNFLRAKNWVKKFHNQDFKPKIPETPWTSGS